MKKVLWFSRHNMTTAQVEDLERIYGPCIITKVTTANLPNVHVPFKANVNDSVEELALPPFKHYLTEFDVVAIVMPLNLQEQVLKVSGVTPVIIAKNNRIAKLDENDSPVINDRGEQEFVFQHAGWFQVLKIEVVTQEL